MGCMFAAGCHLPMVSTSSQSHLFSVPASQAL
uniref:Uncharacterized protein n=1 Tax=Anguilla anguilla TaxID=7936 RepID=A0A0E9RJB8_ANGAN